MKLTHIISIAGFVMLFSAPTFAVEQNIAVKQLTDKLTQARAPQNVSAMALKFKLSTCTQNAKNFNLQGIKKDDYILGCLNKNEAKTVIAKYNAINFQLLVSNLE
jgi:hypothetical protein